MATVALFVALGSTIVSLRQVIIIISALCVVGAVLVIIFISDEIPGSEGETKISVHEIMKCVEMAPSNVRIYARDSSFDMELGSGRTYIGPMMGGIRILQKDGSFRPATVDDMIIADKIVESNNRYQVNGGVIWLFERGSQTKAKNTGWNERKLATVCRFQYDRNAVY